MSRSNLRHKDKNSGKRHGMPSLEEINNADIVESIRILRQLMADLHAKYPNMFPEKSD